MKAKHHLYKKTKQKKTTCTYSFIRHVIVMWNINKVVPPPRVVPRLFLYNISPPISHSHSYMSWSTTVSACRSETRIGPAYQTCLHKHSLILIWSHDGTKTARVYYIFNKNNIYVLFISSPREHDILFRFLPWCHSVTWAKPTSCVLTTLQVSVPCSL